MAATRSNAIGAPGYRETLRCRPESVRRARRLVDTALQTWGLDSLIDDMTLVTSELVTNAVDHSRCRYMHVRISRLGKDRVRVAVTDRSFVRPVLREPSQYDQNGRGLFLVEALADCWGTERRSFGKSVWAELITEGESNP
ncbi:ATP-binding protein [Streptomyces rimosus]|uniref:ATP-binding protein n=1 Tax=Streptomyces rimosus TaxID=1927 RepID=UPI00379C7FA8